jgi:hypothetical protein
MRTPVRFEIFPLTPTPFSSIVPVLGLTGAPTETFRSGFFVCGLT